MGTLLNEVRVMVAELHGFGGTTGCIVFWIKVEHHCLPHMRCVCDAKTASGIGFEFWKGFVDNDRHRVFESRVQNVSGELDLLLETTEVSQRQPTILP